LKKWICIGVVLLPVFGYVQRCSFIIPFPFLQGATQLTNLATNRGRGMIDSNPEYTIEQVLQNRIKENAAAETAL
jgi:hypothetical protein